MAWDQANAELRQVAAEARRLAVTPRGAALHNSGIAGTPVVAAFSLALTRWLVARFGEGVRLASVDGEPSQVMALLEPALDPMEREVLSEQTLRWPAWQRRHLGREGTAQLRRLLHLIRRLPGGSAEQEATFASMRIFVRWDVPPDAPVATTGRFEGASLHFHPGPLRRHARPGDAWHDGPGRRVRLVPKDRHALMDLARGTLAALLSETDPFTYVSESEIELHDLGHGIQVALFPCIPARKLALEAYVGYLLLKNQVPVAYGGGWVLGRQARFGINILPPFRGGESAVLLSQLLRVYAHRFGLKSFLVEPFQIGKGNADGIRSGAFWFYWRLGFRPRQPTLLAAARREARRLRTPGTRTPPALLRRLSASVMAWETPLEAKWDLIDVDQVGAQVSRHILAKFDGDRRAAQAAAVRALGLRDHRLAVLLAALAPEAGWTPGEIARLDRIMALKDHAELRQAVALRQHRRLMRTLAGASGPAGGKREARREKREVRREKQKGDRCSRSRQAGA